MAVARTPRTAWIAEGSRVLAAGGPDAVRVEALAKSLGVTKGGFYGYFDSRGDLLEEILDAWEHATTDEVIEQVEREGGEPRDKARRAGMLTFSSELVPLDLAVRDWARRDPSVAERLRRVDNRRMDYLRSQLRALCDDEEDLEVRCMIAFSIGIATHFIVADHGGLSRAEVMGLAAQRLFGD